MLCHFLVYSKVIQLHITCVYVRTCVCMCVCTRVRACMRVCVRVCACVCVFLYMDGCDRYHIDRLTVVSNSLQPHGLYSPQNSPGQNTGVGSLSLLQGVFPTQGSNPGLPHCRQTLYQLSHQGSPRTLEWGACPFSRSSRPRNPIWLFCIAGGFFTN